MLPMPTTAEIQLSFKKELVAKNYQAVLDAAATIEFTKENIAQDLLAPVSTMLSELKNVKDNMKRPYLDANKTIDEMFNDMKRPLEAIFNEKNADKQKIARELEAERKKMEQERSRVAGIVQYTNNFILNATNFAKSAKSPEDLVKLERRIGSEKSRKSFFAEFYDDFCAKMDALRPLIAEQKEVLKQFSALSEQKDAAIEEGNMTSAMERMEELEGVQEQLNAAKTAVELTAFSTTSSVETYVPEHDAAAVTPKRVEFRYRVEDIEKLKKHHPELVSLVLNEVAAKEFLRKNKQLLGKDDEKDFGGITIFKNKKF